MTGKQLKNSILQWAIQGKLVPQDPNDEPASVLLERIREEKKRLIKEGKIKKDKNESIIFRGDDNSYYEKFADGKVVCIDEEIPFEIPAGWEWCRLGTIIDFSRNNTVKSQNISNESWVLDLEDIEKDTGVLITKKRMGSVLSKSDKHSFNVGEVLYSKLRPYLNKVIIADEPGYCTTEILPFDFGFIHNSYAQLYLMSPFFVEYAMSDAYGVKMPRLGSKQGNAALMPIPPISEQFRIVAAVNAITPWITKYSSAYLSLQELNDTIADKIKKSILQEAIHGKLVPQDSADEPATTLLKRISAEKQILVKDGKLKAKDALTSVIFKGDDNKYYEKIGNDISEITDLIPFEIPNNWCWARAASIAQISMGQSPDGESINTTKGVEFHQGKIHFTEKYLAHASCYTSQPSKYAEPLSLLLCVRAPVGVANITERRICIGRGLCALNFYEGINLDLMFYFFTSYKNYYEDLATGSTFKAISKDIVADTLVPIPPENEQVRIVDLIKAMYAKLS